MAITSTPRLGLTKWGDPATDGPTHQQFNDDHDDLDDLVAIDVQGTLAAQQALAAGTRGRWYSTTDTKELFRDDGTAWLQLPTFATAGTWTKKQIIQSNTTDQLLVETATNSSTARTVTRRRTTDDGSNWTQAALAVNASVMQIIPNKHNTSGFVTSNLSGMEGRWGINQAGAIAPASTLVINSRSGPEIARFTEGGFFGVGNDSPTFLVDVRAPAGQTSVARFGGPAADNQEYALTITPYGQGRSILGFGAEVTAGSFTARSSSAGLLDIDRNTLAFYGDSGLSVGSSYSRTKRFEITSSGQMVCADIYLGTGALGGSSPRMRAWTYDSDEFVMSVSRSSGSCILVLEAQGNGGAIHIKPEGALGSSFYRQGSAHITANLGWSVAGAEFGVSANQDGTNHPAYKIVRVTDIADSQGAVQSVHNLGIVAQRVLSVDSWIKGPNGEAVKMKTTSFNGDRIYAHVWDHPNSGYAGRRVVHYVMFAQTTVTW